MITKQAERFWSKVQWTSDEECWPWLGAKSGGYGQITIFSKRKPAHVVSWELAHEMPFPAGKYGCHSCDNPGCVNPNHILPRSQQWNVLDAMNKQRFKDVGRFNRAKTHCRKGHLFDNNNTGPVNLDGYPKIYRRCLKCHALRERKRYHERKSQCPSL